MDGPVNAVGNIASIAGKSLPKIAPEAYDAVKGLKGLYSRLTDTMTRAPQMMHPDKVRSLAAQGTSKEEISLRKLEDFLKGRNPNAQVSRDEVMEHLRQNPIELNVSRKGDNLFSNNDVHEKLYRFQHELDTKYGPRWAHRDQLRVDEITSRPIISDEEWNIYQELELASANAIEHKQTSGTTYGFLQTPGAKENYGETLINYIDDSKNFQTPHFNNEPNNIVWSRHNDRTLPPSVGNPNSTGKGRFIEEIQSDLHQQGRELGYEGQNSELDFARETLGKNTGQAPDLPFKSTYPDLALKQQLLDAANDPSLEWLGVADANTVSKMEGHAQVKPGMELNYDQKYPSALKRLLEPLGGKVGYDELPGSKLYSAEGATPTDEGSSIIRAFTAPNQFTEEGQQIASIIPSRNSPLPSNVYDDFNSANKLAQQIQASGRTLPGPGFFKANLTPEIKQMIKERGFPAMAALLALKRANVFSGEEK